MKNQDPPRSSPREALNDAIDRAGGISAFAAQIEAPSVNAVKAWRRNGVPEKYCPTIERVTRVTCERLAPAVEWAVLRKPLPVAPAANDVQA